MTAIFFNLQICAFTHKPHFSDFVCKVRVVLYLLIRTNLEPSRPKPAIDQVNAAPALRTND